MTPYSRVYAQYTDGLYEVVIHSEHTMSGTLWFKNTTLLLFLE